ncbi:hypothetical protein BJ322DRAFT_1017157 [Thelephora terrestris]|uniref:NADH-ubiquinone oxidoreductase 12 kDa subunit n=1 Tax=Thelephora terrestris TaxID=56493 RepID=A0A9P6HNK4_9AGAM|nr:hypothetical protein BJ322DRAFT_1017157 [Thelephora terrestris]
MATDGTKAALIEAKLKAREEHIRENWIKAMEARIVRDNLSKCQKVEGVNHYERCKDLAERYADMLKENRYSSKSYSLRASTIWTQPTRLDSAFSCPNPRVATILITQKSMSLPAVPAKIHGPLGRPQDKYKLEGYRDSMPV